MQHSLLIRGRRMVRRYEVVVVGGGPAGAMAAKAASKGGVTTALLERKRDVGLPVRCGEAVGVKGTALSIKLKDEWLLAPVKKMDMISPAGHRVSLEIKNRDESFIIDRSKMDPDLVKMAIANGCDYHNLTSATDISREQNGEYKITTNNGEFFARIVILADGVESRLAKIMGWDTTLTMQDIETCAFLQIEHENVKDETIELFPGSKRAPGGFVWVFPRGGKKANVGLGILGSFSKPGKAKELIESFANEKFPNAKITHQNCGGVPVGKWLNPLVKDGVMIVGDAARQVNSLNGGGIAYSLFAGKIAGETAAEYLNSSQNSLNYLKKYQKRWNRYCGKQQMRQYAMKTLLLEKQNDEFLDRIALSLLKENPKKMNYFRVFARTFIKHPMMLFKTFMVFR